MGILFDDPTPEELIRREIESLRMDNKRVADEMKDRERQNDNQRSIEREMDEQRTIENRIVAKATMAGKIASQHLTGQEAAEMATQVFDKAYAAEWDKVRAEEERLMQEEDEHWRKMRAADEAEQLKEAAAIIERKAQLKAERKAKFNTGVERVLNVVQASWMVVAVGFWLSVGIAIFG